MYSQVLSIRRSIQKTKVTKEPLVEDKGHNNENEMNTQNEDGNGMYSALVKEKYKTQPSESNEDTKTNPEESEPQYHVKGNLQDHNIGMVLKTNLLQGSLIFHKAIP